MMVLAAGKVAAMQRHAVVDSPREACGLLVGVGACVYEVCPVPNISPTPNTRYLMAPEILVARLLDYEAKGWELLGIYHSHPKGPPHPSETDVAESFYPDVVYFIVDLTSPAELQLTAWSIRDGSYRPVNWQVGTC